MNAESSSGSPCSSSISSTSANDWAFVRAPRSPGGKIICTKTTRVANRAAQALRLAAAALSRSKSALGP